MADEVEQPARRHEVVDEVPAGTEECRRLRRNVAHLFDRDQAAIGAAGEPRPFRPEQRAPHRREDAVGGDQHVGLDLDAVLELRPHRLAVLLDADAAVRQMHPLARHWPRQHRVQLAAMEDVMRRAELTFDIGGEPRLGQRAAVVPAALMEERRSVGHPGAFLAETEPDQNARGVRADVDAGADLAEQARLLVDLHVEAGLQQADRGGQSTDAAADDRDSDVLLAITRRACRAPDRSPRPRPPGRRRRTARAAASSAPAPDRRGYAPAAPSRPKPAACRRTACGS